MVEETSLGLLRAQNAELREQVAALKGGGGGGTYDGGMGPRVARLESDMDHVKKGLDRIDAGVSDITKTLTDIRVDSSKAHGELTTSLATLQERTKHFPTRWEVFLILSAVATVLAALISLAVRYIPHAA